MIVKMKKLTLLCTRASREVTLDALRDLGAVHLQHVTSPEGEGLEQARRHFEYLRRALEVLPKRAHVAPSGKSAHEVVDEVWKLIHRKQALNEKIELLEIERKRYEAFGDFDVDDILALREQGVLVKLLTTPIKQISEEPDGATLVELGRDRTSAFFALISREPVEIEAEELPLPECSAVGMIKHIDGLREELAEVEEGFAAYIGDHDAVAAIAGEAEDHVVWLEARNGMGKEEEVCYLRGFFPAEREKELRTAASKQGWAVLVEEPAEEDRVPTLLRNAKWVRTIKPLLDMVNLTPGYHETDISPAFLVFFCVFFGMLVGDAGYGLIFLAATTFFRIRIKKAPRAVFNLLTITSAATIIWGAITGVWFGISNPPKILEAMHLTWLDDYYHVMGLCFLIGAVHLTLAHGWQALNKRKTPQMLAEVGWIGSTWAMYFIAADMIAGWPMPSLAMPLLVVSIVLIVLFMTPPAELKKEWIGHAMLPLDVINNFVDVVSYLRLFAVGLATLEVAKAFNGMASGAGWIGAVIILFLGHTMNIAMAVMGVMVHGLRLNALEFSNHVGLEWAGSKYNPFARIKNKGGEQ
jgi:V/A-type H+-transporting ATPase subunit I